MQLGPAPGAALQPSQSGSSHMARTAWPKSAQLGQHNAPRTLLAWLAVDSVCLATFGQPCCGYKDENGSSSFYFLGILHEEKCWLELAASMGARCWWRPRDQQQEARRAIFLMYSLHEINLPALQNSIKTVSIDKA